MVATSGAVRSVVDHPVTDGPLARTWCYYLAEGRWVAGAAINNAGIVLAWLRDQWASVSRATGGREPTLDEVTGWAAEVGAGGALFERRERDLFFSGSSPWISTGKDGF